MATPPVFSTAGCSYYPDTKELVTEASDFFGPQRDIPAGFILRSHKTGKELPFIFWKSQSDGDGSVEAWIFASTVHQYHLRVLND